MVQLQHLDVCKSCKENAPNPGKPAHLLIYSMSQGGTTSLRLSPRAQHMSQGTQALKYFFKETIFISQPQTCFRRNLPLGRGPWGELESVFDQKLAAGWPHNGLLVSVSLK